MKTKVLMVSLFVAVFSMGCVPHSYISKTYDFNSVRSIGVLKVNVRKAPLRDAEELFDQRLLESGFSVVDRPNVNAALKENSINTDVPLDRGMTKKVGNFLGVDLLLESEVASFSNEQKKTGSKKKAKGAKLAKEEKEAAPPVENENVALSESQANKKPEPGDTYSKLELSARLVDVETSQVVWSFSVMEEGSTAKEAADKAVKDLIKEYKEDLKKVSIAKGS